MIVDVRSYVAKPGRLMSQLALYEKHGLPVQLRHLGQPLAFLTSESGDLNMMLHLWAYESAADREQRRAAMAADPGWPTYIKESTAADNLVSQQNNLMIPASFAPIKR